MLLAVAALLTAAAALAIGILLVGDFGSTEGRILATTALLGGYALLTLPAAILHDQRRAPALAAAVAGLALASASLATAGVWTEERHDTLGSVLATANGWLVAAVVTAVLTLRRREHDGRVVRLLFAASSALLAALALMFTMLVWGVSDSERFGRIFGAVVVLTLLVVALQPILARARRRVVVHRLRVRLATGGSTDLTIEAPDLAAAASDAIRAVERAGDRVLSLDVAVPGDRRRASS